MFLKKVLLVTFFFLFSFAGVWGQVGGDPGGFLLLAGGARSLALGNSGSVLIDDASSIHLNPAMSALVPDAQFNVSLTRLALDRTYYDLSVSYPVEPLGTIGLGWVRFGVDKIPGYDQEGFFTQNFADIQTALTFSYSRLFGERLALGVQLNYLNHALAGFSAQGYSFGIGTAYLLSDVITIGIMGSNLSSSLRWNTASGLKEKLPLDFLFGVSFIEPANLPNLLISTDYSQHNGMEMGLEYVLKDMIILRGGYSRKGIAYGLGVMLGSYKLDFAYSTEKFSGEPWLHFTLNLYISPATIFSEEMVDTTGEETPEEEVQAPAEPPITEEELQKAQEQRSIVLIVDGPLKYEKAEVIKINVANNTVTVRLLAVPGAAPITLNMNQVQFIK